MRQKVRCLLLAAACAITAAPLARAADDQASRDASARFQEGLKRFEAGDLEAARLAFTQAHAILDRMDILWNLAVVEEKTNHPLDALAHFKQYIRDRRVVPKDRAAAEKHAAAISAQTGHIEVTAPSGATIVVDGAMNAGTAPLVEPVDVLPGKHKVEARTADRQYAVDVNATPGDVVKASFMAQFAAPAPGASNVAASPGATPASAAPVDTAASASPAAAAATTPGNDQASASTGSGSFFTPKRVTVIAMGGVAVIALGAGVFFALDAGSTNDKATEVRTRIPSSVNCTNNPSADCAQLRDLKSTYDSDKTWESVGFIAGGLLAAGAIVTWLVWDEKPAAKTTTSGAWFVPNVSTSGAGASVVGRF